MNLCPDQEIFKVVQFLVTLMNRISFAQFMFNNMTFNMLTTFVNILFHKVTGRRLNKTCNVSKFKLIMDQRVLQQYNKRIQMSNNNLNTF